MKDLPDNIEDILEEFHKWYEADEHRDQEHAYEGQITKERIANMSDAELVDFFVQFTLDGGFIQSSGHRFAGNVQSAIEQNTDAFRAHVLKPFQDDFDIAAWLAEIDRFKGWGQGTATIYLHRVDPKRFIVFNEKSSDAYELLGYKISGGGLAKQYLALQQAESNLLKRYPEMMNLYRLDAFSHFLIGTDQGKEMSGWNDETKAHDEKELNAAGKDLRRSEWVTEISRADWELFLDGCEELLSTLDIGPDDQVLALNIRNKASYQRIHLTLRQRLAFGMGAAKGQHMVLMLRPDAADRYPNAQLEELGEGLFNGLPKATLYQLSLALAAKQLKSLLPELLDVCDEYVEPGKVSSYRQYHVPELYQLVMDKEYRKQALDYLLDGIGEWPVGNELKLNIDMDYFDQNDVALLDQFGGVKREKNDEHNAAYTNLRMTYNKVGTWAAQVQQALFPEGRTDIRRAPTNQSQDFAAYQWAKIYPSKKGPAELAYTVSLEKDHGFVIKIDTVALDDNDPRRKRYLDYRGDEYQGSSIVKIIPADEGLQLDWKGLIEGSKTFIESISNDYEELSRLFQSEQAAKDDNAEPSDHPLNQILYGPPGTGKTYATTDLAVNIIDGNSGTHAENKRRYDQLVDEGRIVFTTFHQSMAYEDFVEGIKPVTVANINGAQKSSQVTYEIKSGIFKKLCNDHPLLPGSRFGQKDQYRIISVSSALVRIEREAGIVDFSLDFIEDLARVFIEKQLPESALDHSGTEFRNKLKNSVSKSWDPYLYGYEGMLRWLIKHYLEKVKQNSSELPTRVLIIDEINRGNVSAIFGELITLIEKDKRIGGKNKMSCVLPYSKVSFSVPSNLHIIGTMNTADRSVEALDTALRRRFEFKEIMPDSKVIQDHAPHGGELGGFNTTEILNVINARIEVLVDRDHTIGHSYFLEIESLAGLQSCFKNKVIPLLQEYFYGDYGKIGLVLGKGFVRKTDKLVKGFAEMTYDGASDLNQSRFELISIDEKFDMNSALSSLLNIKV